MAYINVKIEELYPPQSVEDGVRICVIVSQSHAAAGAVRHLPSDPASA